MRWLMRRGLPILRSILLLLRFNFYCHSNWANFLLWLCIPSAVAVFVEGYLKIITILAIISIDLLPGKFIMTGYPKEGHDIICEGVSIKRRIRKTKGWSGNLFWIKISELSKSDRNMIFLDWFLSNDSKIKQNNCWFGYVNKVKFVEFKTVIYLKQKIRIFCAKFGFRSSVKHWI